MKEKVEFYKETEFKDTEIGRIPKEWEVIKLRDVLLLLRNGITLRQRKERNGYPVTRIETISEEKIDPSKLGYVIGLSEKDIEEHRLIEGDILFSHINSIEHIGKTAIYEGVPDFLLHGMNLLLLRPDKNKVHPKFLLYLLRLLRARKTFWIMSKKAVNQASINQTELGNLRIFFPSLEEQQKIAEILSTIDGAIQKTDEIIDKTESLKKGLMQELFTKGIGHEEFKDTEIGRIPKEWEAIRFGDIVNLVKGRRPREFTNERVRDSLPYLSAENLRNNNIVQFVKVSDDIILVDEGDLILIWDGSNAGEFFLGKRGVLSSTMVKILLKEKLYHGRFLFYLLKTKENYLKDQTKGTGIPHVDGTILRSLVIPLPTLEEQQKIAEILSTIDKKLEVLKQEKVKLEKIKQWFMDELLTGKIRVKVS
jgi:type I restriction enzyme S subunit